MKPFRSPIAYVALFIVAAPKVSCCAEDADLVLRGGTIRTVDRQHPIVEAIAVRGDRIVAVGSQEAIQKHVGSQTRIIELDGRLAIPGFIEGHGHFVGLGIAKMTLDLTNAKSWEDIIIQVSEAAKNTSPDTWIVGRGWHQAKWDRPPKSNVNGYPTHDRLSEFIPSHPVLLTHASGHMSFANRRAMELAAITKATRDPPGGEILRNVGGEPIGVFRETAQSLFLRARSDAERHLTARQARDKIHKAIRLAADECLAKGITTFHDAGCPLSTIDIYRRLAHQGKLPVRMWAMVREDNDRLARDLARYRTIGAGNHFLTVRAIKRSIDGALGPHGAWLLEPYDDLPSSSGLNTSPISSIERTAQLAVKHDYQLCVHAIGDRANRETLDIFEAAFRASPQVESRRWRIEHAQHLSAIDIPRFRDLGVIASMQGIHCTSDAVFVMQRLGQRRSATGAYAWRRLLDSGATIINGSDVPVEDVDPLLSFYASVTRRLNSGVTFFTEQCMTREEALRSYTRDAAYAAFEEKIKGSLTVGKLADIVVLSHDIMTCPAEQISQSKVIYTIVGGKVVVSPGSPVRTSWTRQPKW